MTHPIVNARLRPMMAPTLAPVIMRHAMTSVYAVIAPWIPLTVVPTSFATVAIETFMTELSRVMRNWPGGSVISTGGPARGGAFPLEVMVAGSPRRRRGALTRSGYDHVPSG